MMPLVRNGCGPGSSFLARKTQKGSNPFFPEGLHATNLRNHSLTPRLAAQTLYRASWPIVKGSCKQMRKHDFIGRNLLNSLLHP
jgi:hypothetical protein